MAPRREALERPGTFILTTVYVEDVIKRRNYFNRMHEHY
jgi:hypothetical protein